MNLPNVLDRSYESDIINQKYDFIGEVISEVLMHKQRQDVLTEKADAVLTQQDLGYPGVPGHYGRDFPAHVYGRRLA